MQEIELKFLIPESRLKGMMRQVKVKSSQTTPMAAHYYDTPEQTLSKQGIGLRIRQEGENWVQTIKAGGDGIAARLEHNIPLDNEQVQAMLEANALMPDLTLYQDTSIAPLLADLKLKKLAKKLTCLYVTDVQRTTRLLKEVGNKEDNPNGNNSIEIAYDDGQIIHGSDDTQCLPIQEIEFELLSGNLDYFFATATVWCKRYTLCLSTVTKAERGGLLIKEQDYSPAVSANLAQLTTNKDNSMPTFIRAVVHNCLLQILPNSSAIAAGSVNNDHVLQLRVGIRRLRCALKAFGTFSDQLNPEWLPILKQTATSLGDYRTLAQLASHIQPALEQQGAPYVDWTIEIDSLTVTPIIAIRDNDFQLMLLELIAFTMSDTSLEPQADTLASDKLATLLSKQYTKLLKANEQYAYLVKEKSDNNADAESPDDTLTRYETEHTLRRQLKNMRYMSEFAAPLYATKKSNRWLKRLVKAQNSLGQSIDDSQYQQHYQHKSLTDTNALYGAGWFAATLQTDNKHWQKHLAKVKACKTFW